MKISYAVSVNDEIDEFKRLLEFLIKHIDKNDEIVIQQDTTKEQSMQSMEVTAYTIKIYNENENVHSYFYPLKGDFSKFKNNLNEQCTGDYIFQIDADELPSINLITNIHEIIEANPDVDLFKIPRENLVEGISDAHIKQWGWELDENNRINYPDLQSRIYKNSKDIVWKNKVHEIITGAKMTSWLPLNEGLELIHRKTILKQEQQNEFYSTL